MTLLHPTDSSESKQQPELPDIDLTDPVVAAAYAEAVANEEDLTRQGLSIGDVDDDLNAAGYEPVIFSVGADGQPEQFFSAQ